MRFAPIAFVLLVVVAVLCRAQEQSRENATQAEPAHELESYLVELTEFRLADEADAGFEVRDIVTAFDELKKNGKVKLIETVRVSALESHESGVQFGKRVAVTIGNTATQFGKARNMQDRELGTRVELKALPQQGKVLLKLVYEASRLSDNGTEDSPPDTLITRCNATVLLEQGVPRLLSSTSAESSSYLLILVSKQ